MRILIATTLGLTSLLCASAIAETTPDGSARSWYVQAGGYLHYSEKDYYEGPPLFGGIERHREKNTLLGFSVFNNSFGDFTQYLYWGKQWNPWENHPALRLKLTVGIVHGYEGDNQDVTPIYWGDAWGIGAVPTFGYQKNRLGFDLALLGNSGALFLIGYEF